MSSYKTKQRRNNYRASERRLTHAEHRDFCNRLASLFFRKGYTTAKVGRVMGVPEAKVWKAMDDAHVVFLKQRAQEARQGNG